MAEPEAAAARRFARRLAEQAAWCYELGSPLYGDLLVRAAADALDGGPVAAVLDGRDTDPGASMLALRLMGAVHRLVLAGAAPALAAHYPSAGGSPGPGVWDAFRDVLAEHRDALRVAVAEPVQTNEPGRAAPLLAGLLTLAGRFGLPVRLLELGASGGLNLRLDHYRYETPYGGWGPAGSPLVLDGFLAAGRLPLAAPLRVVDRAGCDPRPVDPTTGDGRLRLTSFVWPDQVARLERLRGALDVAPHVPAPVDAADAADWLPAQLAEPPDGTLTVVAHTVMWQYVPDASKRRIEAALDLAGARATERAPLARLAFEPGRDAFELRATTWPGGASQLVATAAPHGGDLRVVTG